MYSPGLVMDASVTLAWAFEDSINRHVAAGRSLGCSRCRPPPQKAPVAARLAAPVAAPRTGGLLAMAPALPVPSRAGFKRLLERSPRHRPGLSPHTTSWFSSSG